MYEVLHRSQWRCKYKGQTLLLGMCSISNKDSIEHHSDISNSAGRGNPLGLLIGKTRIS